MYIGPQPIKNYYNRYAINMKSFEEVKSKITLIRYIGSEFGTMYFEPDLSRNNKVIIRHLDNQLTVELLPIYVELYNAVIKWIDDNPKVEKYVFMPSLLEVGKDYFIRRFYGYDIAISDYMDKEDEDYIEPPELFEEMRNFVSQELKEVSGREGVIQQVLRKSLLEPTNKTIYEYRINKFIIVEPKILLTDLNEWKKLSNS